MAHSNPSLIAAHDQQELEATGSDKAQSPYLTLFTRNTMLFSIHTFLSRNRCRRVFCCLSLEWRHPWIMLVICFLCLTGQQIPKGTAEQRSRVETEAPLELVHAPGWLFTGLSRVIPSWKIAWALWIPQHPPPFSPFLPAWPCPFCGGCWPWVQDLLALSSVFPSSGVPLCH